MWNIVSQLFFLRFFFQVQILNSLTLIENLKHKKKQQVNIAAGKHFVIYVKGA